jgi:hypothetical protein
MTEEVEKMAGASGDTQNRPDIIDTTSLERKRSISKTPARKLSEFFHVPVSLFI